MSRLLPVQTPIRGRAKADHMVGVCPTRDSRKEKLQEIATPRNL
jgi:hypothetical protein